MNLMRYSARVALNLFLFGTLQSFGQIVITIDNFNSGGPTPASTEIQDRYPGDSGDIVGESRLATFFGLPDTAMVVANGNLEVEAPVSRSVVGVIEWGGTQLSGPGDLNLNLSGAGADHFELSVPLTSSPSLILGLSVNNVLQQFPPLVAGGTVSLPFSAFGAVDFSNVDIIQLRLPDNVPAGVFQVDSLTAVGAIPEPEHGVLVMAFAIGIYVLNIRLRLCVSEPSP
jgi:hypothetical protein